MQGIKPETLVPSQCTGRKEYKRKNGHLRISVVSSAPFAVGIPGRRLRNRLFLWLPALILLIGLGACAEAPAPSPAPSTAPTTTAAPPTIAPTASAALTPTPPSISAATLPALRPLRAFGLGRAVQAALAPGGQRLAVATTAGLALYELPSRRLIRFEAVDGGVRDAALSADGALLAWPDPANSARSELRRADDGALLATLDGTAPVFSPDGQLIATSGDTTFLWQRDGTALLELAGTQPSFSPDGQILATLLKRAEGGMELALYRLPDGQSLTRVPLAASSDDSPRIAFSTDTRLVSVLFGSRLLSWTVADGQPADETPVPAGRYHVLAPGGAVLATFPGGGEGLLAGIRFVRLADGTVLARDEQALFPDPLAPPPLAFNADGSSAAFVTIEGRVHILDLAQGTAAEIDLPGFTSLAFSPDGSLLAAGRRGPELLLWNTADATLQQQRPAADASYISRIPRRLLFTADGRALVAEEERVSYGTINVAATRWELASDAPGRPLWEFTALDGSSTGFNGVWAFSAATQTAAWAEAGGIQLRSSAGITTTLATAQMPAALEFNPDGALLAAGNADGLVTISRVSDGAQSDSLRVGAPVQGFAFSPDGRLLAILHGDRAATDTAPALALSVWRIGTAQPQLDSLALGASGALPASPGSMAFTPDNALICVSDGESVAFYRLADGAELRRIDIAARALALDPTGRFLALLHDERLVLWGVEA